MMWWAVWCVAMVAGSTGAVPAPFYDGALIDPVIYHWGNIWTPDDSTQLTDHSVDAWPSSNGVSGVNVPRYEEESGRGKRGGTTLSIDMPMRLLRDKLNQIMTEKIKNSNREYLKTIGKRGAAWVPQGLERAI
ncbi:diuretic hormone 41 isoform X3 [Hyposmocoma kahamanoa]|uniref:diuretic hormone 41 isoform X3 n=1 Tax=Hyposmocoma kahamanoa TaxID=1477025 RepID=UPI000E6D818A|nr:diuretic hormone 41 isoform X3 [Hyposmocoma kahamanoa]